MAVIPDKTLLKIANDIGGSDPKVLALGLELDFTKTETSQYIATNKGGAEVTAEGTSSMLFAWSRKTPSKDQVRILRAALVEVDLGTIADKWLPTAEGSQPSSSSSSSSSGQSSATGSRSKVTPEQITKLLDDFPRNKYHRFCYNLIGYGHNRAQDLLKQELNDSRAALHIVLADWVDKTDGYRNKLEEALRATDVGGLIDKTFN